MATAAEFDTLLNVALGEATQMTTELVSRLGIDQLAGWSLDEAKARLLFADVHRRAALMAAQVVGLYEASTQRFEWAWNDSSFPPVMLQASKHVRGWGEVNAMPLLTTAVQTLDDVTAWKLAAFTARLIDWPGIYRGSGGPTEIFLAFSPTTIADGTTDRIGPAAVYALPSSMAG